MARINIEDNWWNDPRRRTLRLLLGSREASEHIVANAWRTGYDYWCNKKGCMLIPGAVFIHFDGYKELILSGLAILYKDTILVNPITFRTQAEHNPTRPEQESTDVNTIKQCSIYLAGMRDSLLNLMVERSKKSEAGKRSAQKRLKTYGTSQPKVEHNRTQSNTPRTQSNTPELSSSNSLSSSVSVSSLRNVPFEEVTLDFESIYQLYPKRKGSQHKGAAISLCKRKFKTKEEFDRLERAVRAYRNHIKNEGHEATEFVSQFKTFVGSLWEEWVPQAPKVVQNAPHVQRTYNTPQAIEPELTPEEREEIRLAKEKIASMQSFNRAMPK